MSRTLADLGLDKRSRELDVVRRFGEIVGAAIAQQAEALKIDNGVLVVRVASSSWRQQLNYSKAEMIAKLNQAFGENTVKDIYFT